MAVPSRSPTISPTLNPLHLVVNAQQLDHVDSSTQDQGVPVRSAPYEVLVNAGVILGAGVLLGSVWFRQPLIGAALAFGVVGAIGISQKLRRPPRDSSPHR